MPRVAEKAAPRQQEMPITARRMLPRQNWHARSAATRAPASTTRARNVAFPHARHAVDAHAYIAGQHVMQAQSDIFLGWTRVTNPVDGVDRDFYVRQLKDWKFSVPVEILLPQGMTMYARLCGWTLARAHARSGDRIALAAYLGGSAKFDQAIADFAETYADENESDYAAFRPPRKKARSKLAPRSKLPVGSWLPNL